jgi:hypothetical protein
VGTVVLERLTASPPRLLTVTFPPGGISGSASFKGVLTAEKSMLAL